MGALYSVFPLDSKMAAYLRKEKVAVPKKLPRSRLPTPAELRRVAKSLPKVTARMVTHGAVLAQIDLASKKNPETGPWTMINILKNVGEDEPCDFYFEKGWPELIVELLIRLTEVTGPLVLVPDTGECPVLIDSTVQVKQALSAWVESEG